MRNLLKIFYVVLMVATTSTTSAHNLLTLYQQAQQHNQHWASQQYDYLANRVNEDLARGDLLPQIGLQGSVKQNHFYPTSNGIANSHATTSQVGIGLRQALFRSDKQQTLAKAEVSQDIFEIQLLKQQQQLAEQVVRAYLSVLKAEAMDESLQMEYTALKTQHDMMQARLAQGVVAQVDTKEAFAQLQNVQALLANNDVAILNAKQQLSLLTNASIDKISPLKDELDTNLVEPKSLELYLNLAKEENFDILLAKHQVMLAQANQNYLKSHLYPKVDLVADVAWQDNNHPALANNKGVNYGIGIELELPLYTGGRTLKGLQQGAFQAESAMSQLKFAYQQVMTQTSQAYLNVMAQKTTITAQRIAVNANQQVAIATQTGYDLGMRSMVDTLLAQRQFYNAKRQLINAYFDYLNAYVDLQIATGQLNDNIEKMNNLLKDHHLSETIS